MSSEVEPASSRKTIRQYIQKLVTDEVLSRERKTLIHFSPWERLPPGVLVPKIEIWEDACRKRTATQVRAPIQVFGTVQSFHHDYIKVFGNFNLWKHFGRQSNGLPEGYDGYLARFPTPAYVNSGGAETPMSVDTAYQKRFASILVQADFGIYRLSRCSKFTGPTLPRASIVTFSRNLIEFGSRRIAININSKGWIRASTLWITVVDFVAEPYRHYIANTIASLYLAT